MKIYVGNLAYSVTDDQLQTAFGAFGEVTSATVISDKFSGQSKGFGFVEMPDNARRREGDSVAERHADRWPQREGQRSEAARGSSSALALLDPRA